MNSMRSAIESRILTVRGLKVILDRDLAELYGVETKRLNEQVKRNIKRFPSSFMFQINEAEKGQLVAICDRLRLLKHSSSMPYAFTEHGALMSANILNSEKAIQISILIIEAFVRLREIASSRKEIINKISEIESRVEFHDETLVELIEAVRKLLPMANTRDKKKIGFTSST